MNYEVYFLHPDKHWIISLDEYDQACYELILRFFDGHGQAFSQFPKKASLQCLYNIPKKVRDEVDFFDADKHQSFRISILWASKFSTIWQAWLWKREGHGDGNDQAFLKYSK